VKNEYITAEQAEQDYGVLVDPRTFAVLGLTAARREREKQQ
jgi:N-methylhydantoinase B